MSEQTNFKPSLGLMDATMIVAGSMIGSGIFIVSADITRNVGSAGWLILVWVITGFLTLTAALSYGELSAMFPKAGGQYVYLKEAYNPLVGFLYGWSFFTVIQTGTIAAVGVAFSKFAGYFLPALDMKAGNELFTINFGQLFSFSIFPAQLVSIAIIVFLTWINTRGVKEGKIIQNFFTVTKLVSLFGIILFGFIIGAKASIWNINWQDAWHIKSMQTTAEGSSISYTYLARMGILGAVAASMVGSVFSSDAWNNVTFIAGEIKNPMRNIGLSLFLGTLIVTFIYVSANLMYLSVLPLESIGFAQQDRVAVAASNSIFGQSGTYLIAAMIMISTFGCNNGLILSGARVYYTMAKDGLFFAKAGVLSNKAVPRWALWAQCVWASLLCLSGRYGDLLDYVVFTVMIFYILTILGIFILRKKRPEAERPYKAFGYPVLPALYIILASLFCVCLLYFKPNYTWPGLIIVLAGIPIYYMVLPGSKKATA